LENAASRPASALLPGPSSPTGWVDGLIEEREKHGSELFSLTQDQLAKAQAAFERLAEYDVSLDDRLITGENSRPARSSEDLSELEKEFIASRKNIGCKEETVKQYRARNHLRPWYRIESNRPSAALFARRRM
jgi:uncharacterized protein YdcH (DUF465 family)